MSGKEILMKIAVYCGSAPGNDPAFADSARELGRWIGTNGHTLIYGGGDSGIMGTVAEAAKNAGMNTVCIPKENERDLSEISEEIIGDMEILPVEHMDQVIKAAFA